MIKLVPTILALASFTSATGSIAPKGIPSFDEKDDDDDDEGYYASMFSFYATETGNYLYGEVPTESPDPGAVYSYYATATVGDDYIFTVKSLPTFPVESAKSGSGSGSGSGSDSGSGSNANDDSDSNAKSGTKKNGAASSNQISIITAVTGVFFVAYSIAIFV